MFALGDLEDGYCNGHASKLLPDASNLATVRVRTIRVWHDGDNLSITIRLCDSCRAEFRAVLAEHP